MSHSVPYVPQKRPIPRVFPVTRFVGKAVGHRTGSGSTLVVQMIHVLVVADIRIYREGMTDALARIEQLEVVGGASSLEAAVQALRAIHPDVVIVDMAMHSGLATARALLDAEPGLRIIGLGVPDAEQDLIACAEAGIAGLVPREASLYDLVATLESTVRGELLCSPRMAAVMLRRLARLAAERDDTSPAIPLTAREREILEFLDRGLSNKEIARGLGIEVPTVKNHVHNILEKLKVHRRGEAAALIRRRTNRPSSESKV